MLLNKHNFLVTEFVSKEQSRYSLNALQVNEKGTCATDEHQLVRISLPKVDEQNYPEVDDVTAVNGEAKAFLLDRDVAKQIAKAIPNERTLTILNHARVCEGTEDAACLVVTDLKSSRVFRPKNVTGQFPNVDTVIPKDDERPVFEICVNAKLLAGILKAVAQFVPGANKSCRLSFYGNDKAMRIKAANSETEQDLTGMLMPLRM